MRPRLIIKKLLDLEEIALAHQKIVTLASKVMIKKSSVIKNSLDLKGPILIKSAERKSTKPPLYSHHPLVYSQDKRFAFSARFTKKHSNLILLKDTITLFTHNHKS